MMSRAYEELAATLGMVDIAKQALARGDHPVAVLMERFPSVALPLTVEATRLAQGEEVNEFWIGALEAAERAEQERHRRAAR